MDRRLLLCSEEDIASVNIRNALIGSKKWEDDGSLLYLDDMALMSIPTMHIRSEGIDEKAKDAGMEIKEIIFLSRHKAASGIPTLTVHPIGNFHDADLGGRPRTLVMSSPKTMTGLLRSLSSLKTEEFRVSFEVTHHGPWVSVPSTFIEIGSDEARWNDRNAAMMIADAIYGLEEDDHPAAVGIGGGHYAPRFTEVSLTHQINFGHMIPEYAFRDSDDEELARMLADAAMNTGTKCVYVHKRSMNGETARRVLDVIGSCGLEPIKSSDLIENR